MAIFELWFVGAQGGIAWWLFLVALAVGAGWLWSYLMWQVLKGDIERISSQLNDRQSSQIENPK
jgi:hypothetical protein